MFTSITSLASNSKVDMALFSCLLHELHHQLVSFSQDSSAIHTDEFITRPQTPILICCPILNYMPYVDLEDTFASFFRIKIKNPPLASQLCLNVT